MTGEPGPQAAPGARLGMEAATRGRELYHAVLLRELVTGPPFGRTVAPGAALCGAGGELPGPVAGLFPPALTCVHCSVEARRLGLVIEIPGG